MKNTSLILETIRNHPSVNKQNPAHLARIIRRIRRRGHPCPRLVRQVRMLGQEVFGRDSTQFGEVS